MSTRISAYRPRRRHTGRAAARHSQAGLGLIEILIAVVLVSVGFLAGARMQMESMRFSQSAYYRSQAYFMANDIIDRMRANVEGVQDGNYDGGSTSAEQTRPDCTTNRCSPAEIATLDLAEWTDYLNPTTNAPPALPSSATTTATGTINAVGGGQFTVSLVWAEGDDTDQLDIHFLAEN